MDIWMAASQFQVMPRAVLTRVTMAAQSQERMRSFHGFRLQYANWHRVLFELCRCSLTCARLACISLSMRCCTDSWMRLNDAMLASKCLQTKAWFTGMCVSTSTSCLAICTTRLQVCHLRRPRTDCKKCRRGPLLLVKRSKHSIGEWSGSRNTCRTPTRAILLSGQHLMLRGCHSYWLQSSCDGKKRVYQGPCTWEGDGGTGRRGGGGEGISGPRAPGT